MPQVVEQRIDLEPFQADFFDAVNRFPAMIAAWGTGKTMLALQKGILLSEFYENNLGCIIRSKFTDLRDSTMKDFNRYTGIHVPQGTKEAKVGNSTILFRHAKELSGLQNVNLGWFYMEQAEEFPTDTQFTLLRGRLRRELKVNPNYQIDPDSEFYELLCALRDAKDGLRQGMVIANSNGHNWCWKKWIKSPQAGYSCVEATTFDNIDNLPADFIDDLRTMKEDSPNKFAQYVMNDHSEIDLEASYFAASLSALRKRGKICVVPHDPSVLTNIVADVGFDCTAIWLFQLVGQEIRVIDYYENTGKPINHYISILEAKKLKYGYQYSQWFMPHDANQREMQTGITLAQAVKNLGFDVKLLERELNVDFGINRVLQKLPMCWFDEDKCEIGLEGLEHYRRTYNEDLKVYMEKPLHDWASHPADSFRYLTKALTSVASNRNSESDGKDWQALKRKYG